MEKILKSFNELSTQELYEILQARVEIFVVEQNCPYQDIDGLDQISHHLVYKIDEKVAAYLRIYYLNEETKECALGRVITVQRGTGLGLKLILEGIEIAKNLFGAKTITIGAQLYAKGFYEKAGFKQISDIYLEDGIKHIKMRINL